MIPPVDDVAERLAEPHEPASVALPHRDISVRQATSDEPGAQALDVGEVVMPLFEVGRVEEVLKDRKSGRRGRPAARLRVWTNVTTHRI